MIDKATGVETIIRKLKRLPVGHAIDLLTYKRNRSVRIRRSNEDRFDVVENGFFQDSYHSTLPKMKKLLKTLFKREFPRSTKIRLYDLGEAELDEQVKRKTL